MHGRDWTPHTGGYRMTTSLTAHKFIATDYTIRIKDTPEFRTPP